MWSIFIGSLLLSTIHATIPNHWVPLITISRSDQWNIKETMTATLITGLAHTLSTVLIGIIVGFIGIKITESYGKVMNYLSPLILASLGIIYILSNFQNHHHHHHHHPSENEDINDKNVKKSKIAILISLSLAMFLTPCVEIEAYYFQAGKFGWGGILMVSAVYTFSTVIIMSGLVFLGYKGLKKINFHFLDHYEKLITGSILLVFGILSYYVR